MTFFTDDRLRQAAQEAGAILDGSLPAPEDCAHTFSLPFQAKMAKLLRRRKRARPPGHVPGGLPGAGVPAGQRGVPHHQRPG